MSVEALWSARFGDIASPGTWQHGGVIVFETGRLFGGDSGTYYLGTYDINQGKVTADFEVVIFDPRYGTIFGELGERSAVTATGTMKGDKIVGLLERLDVPSLKIAFDLTKQADLP